MNGDKGTEPKISVSYSSDHEGVQKRKWEDEAFEGGKGHTFGGAAHAVEGGSLNI